MPARTYGIYVTTGVVYEDVLLFYPTVFQDTKKAMWTKDVFCLFSVFYSSKIPLAQVLLSHSVKTRFKNGNKMMAMRRPPKNSSAD